jgi:DNA-binding transcriptional LysR family regulator
MLSLNDLTAFLAVAELKSFSRAAEHLHLTQPAISKRVQSLESLLGAPLFDRVGKQVYLTPAGTALLPRAESLLRAAEDTRRLITDLGNTVSGVLHLVTSHHVGLHRLPPVLRAFTREYPDVQFDIRFEDSEAAHDLIRRNASEIAVVTLNPRGAADLESLALWHDPLCFTVAEGHPLGAIRHPLDCAALARERPVLPGSSTFTGRIVSDAFAAEGITLTPNLSTNYLETIAMLVGIGLGWSVLPRTMIRPPLRELATTLPPLARTLGCLTHPQRQLSSAARAFRQVLATYADPEFRTSDDLVP